MVFNHVPTSPGFYMSAVKAFWKHCEKGEIARNGQFLLFPQCFLSVWRTFCHFLQIWKCRLQTLSVWKSLKFVIWERVKISFESYHGTAQIFMHFLGCTRTRVGLRRILPKDTPTKKPGRSTGPPGHESHTLPLTPHRTPVFWKIFLTKGSCNSKPYKKLVQIFFFE